MVFILVKIRILSLLTKSDLTAATVAALTLYDMVKGIDPGMVITEVQLMEKTGGKNDFTRSGRNYHGK